MAHRIRHYVVSTLALLGLLVSFAPPMAAQNPPLDQQGLPIARGSSSPLGSGPVLTHPYLSEPVTPADTRGLPPAPKAEPLTGEPRELLSGFPLPGRERGASPSESPDPVVQRAPGEVNMPAPITNWEGIGATGVLPPDTDGQVGPNHYVQIVNSATGGSQVRVWNKSGAQLYDFNLGGLWPAGNPCRTDAYGDPVVLYDQLANRWLLTQFALPDPPYYECIAVSRTGTPTNIPSDWWPYAFLVHNSKMNDYPKLGIWPDGYYMSANQFTFTWAGAGVWAFDRDAMLTGAPASFQYFDLWGLDPDYGGLLPSNLMGDTLPPAGAPNYFMSVDQNWSGTNDIMHIFEFHTDWVTPANSSFGLVADLVVAPFDWDLCTSSREQCIHQPDGAPRLEAISDRLMMHLWYRNFGDHESLVVNHTVDANGAGRAGIRWYEFRGGAVNTTLADATIYQQGTYTPDGNHRWMGSVAMDHVGNIALGYSVSSIITYPSIRYGGRLATDPLGTLPQAETEIIAGSGVQTHTAARWGDYSAMSVDPVDDCTFWYTQEYIKTTGSAPWQTRVASFRFPSCSGAPQPPSVGTFEPNGGSGTVGQWTNFATTYTDPDGFEDITWAFFFLDRQPPLTSGGLAAAYIPSSDLLVLLGGGYCQPGQPATTVSTAYVTLDCENSSVSGSGGTLTINWRARPDSCFAGGCNWNYAIEFVADSGGLKNAGLVGWWRLNPASGSVRNPKPAVIPTEADLERLGKEIEGWQSQLNKR